MRTIGVDIGGTKIAAGVVDANGNILERLRLDTPTTSVQDVENAIINVTQKLADNHDVSAVGLAPAGFVAADRSRVLFATNMELTGSAIGERVQEATGLRTVVENDANVAGWAEYRFGAGRGASDMVMLTIGTGLGGALILNDQLVRGSFGVAAELGHLRVVRNGRICNCGQEGCWERYASGTALGLSAQAAATAQVERAGALLAAAGGDVDAIEGPHVTELAAQGDELSRELVAELGHWIGEGIAMMAAVLDPMRVVVGGGVAEAGELMLGPARAAYDKYLTARSHRPRLEIEVATMGNDAGIIGAADVARI